MLVVGGLLEQEGTSGFVIVGAAYEGVVFANLEEPGNVVVDDLK